MLHIHKQNVDDNESFEYIYVLCEEKHSWTL